MYKRGHLKKKSLSIFENCNEGPCLLAAAESLHGDEVKLDTTQPNANDDINGALYRKNGEN